MARNGSGDGLSADAVEGLLAYAATQRRFGGRAARHVERAIAEARELAARDPVAHTGLLARALREGAGQHLARGSPARALPLAEEALGLARGLGGAPLAVALRCAAEVLTALDRKDDALSLLKEAERL
ncbi:hypothetical protein [Nonomuraea africana]|uniref:Tetratricopeptide repeat protein n=1 Tax=Nonomuraea africana TaxID=46171 RepID=A0ABR9K9C4_9ACTN|nr:hypothetical protein [Nonomuraea africana]MBE1558401.1 hypothetical protein [Nonomuraea africana]